MEKGDERVHKRYVPGRAAVSLTVRVVDTVVPGTEAILTPEAPNNPAQLPLGDRTYPSGSADTSTRPAPFSRTEMGVVDTGKMFGEIFETAAKLSCPIFTYGDVGVHRRHTLYGPPPPLPPVESTVRVIFVGPELTLELLTPDTDVDAESVGDEHELLVNKNALGSPLTSNIDVPTMSTI